MPGRSCDLSFIFLMRLNRVGGASAVDVDGPGFDEDLAGADGFAGFFFGGIDVVATFAGFDVFAGFLVFLFFGGIDGDAAEVSGLDVFAGYFLLAPGGLDGFAAGEIGLDGIADFFFFAFASAGTDGFAG